MTNISYSLLLIKLTRLPFDKTANSLFIKNCNITFKNWFLAENKRKKDYERNKLVKHVLLVATSFTCRARSSAWIEQVASDHQVVGSNLVEFVPIAVTILVPLFFLVKSSYKVF